MSRQMTVRAAGATAAQSLPPLALSSSRGGSPSDRFSTESVPSPRLEEALSKKIDMSHLTNRMGKVNVLVLHCDGTHEYGLSQGRDELLAAARSEQKHYDDFLASPRVQEDVTAALDLATSISFGDATKVPQAPLSPTSPHQSARPPNLARSMTGSSSVRTSRRPTHHPIAASRDIRRISSQQNMVQSQAVMSRLGAVLMSFVCPPPMAVSDIAHDVTTSVQKIAAIVTVHKCTIIMPPGADSLLSSFTEKLRASLSEAESIPFEFRAIEAVLETVCEMYHGQCSSFEEYSHNFTGQLTDKKPLYWLKRAVLEVITHANATLGVLNEVLENDMDMAMMYLTKLYLEPNHLLDPDLREQHEEMETMLETYLDTMRGTCNRLQLMLRELELREDELELSLDERRNKLLFADIVISVVGVCFALIGAVAGIFGMNLPSGLEENTSVFPAVSIAMGTISLVTAIVVSVAFKFTLS